MTKRTFLSVVMCGMIALAGCGYFLYGRTKTGKFEGSLDIRWIKPDRFVYLPAKDNPLRFITSDNKLIEPKTMFTDAGSIPRLFWGLPGYSPWGYAPSYIIHDWLFEAHRCELNDYKEISFDDSARILAEGIKTLMESGTVPRDETILWTIYEAVRSPVAKSLWNQTGACNSPPEDAFIEPGELLIRINMGGVSAK